MAKVGAPFLSLIARGSVGKSLTATAWKGIKVMKQYSIPSNPQTVDQQSQRARIASAVSFWKTAGLGTEDKQSWDRYAAQLGRRMSGFNAFVGSAKLLLARDAAASTTIDIDYGYVTDDQFSPTFQMLGLASQSNESLSGDSYVWLYGDKPRFLAGSRRAAFVDPGPGGIWYVSASDESPLPIPAGSRAYYQLYRLIDNRDYPVSGIVSRIVEAS